MKHIFGIFIIVVLIASPQPTYAQSATDLEILELAWTVALETPEPENDYFARYLVACAGVNWMHYSAKVSLWNALELGGFAMPWDGWEEREADIIRFVGGEEEWEECVRAATAALTTYYNLGEPTRVTHFHSLRDTFADAPEWAQKQEMVCSRVESNGDICGADQDCTGIHGSHVFYYYPQWIPAPEFAKKMLSSPLPLTAQEEEWLAVCCSTCRPWSPSVTGPPKMGKIAKAEWGKKVRRYPL